MAPGRLFELMEQEAIEDSKLMIAALWLRERLRAPEHDRSVICVTLRRSVPI